MVPRKFIKKCHVEDQSEQDYSDRCLLRWKFLKVGKVIKGDYVVIFMLSCVGGSVPASFFVVHFFQRMTVFF